MRGIIYIYGLFDADNVCQYVGQTKCPTQRHYGQVRAKGGHLGFRILRPCNVRNCDRIERQVTKAYWRNGQAKLSKSAQPVHRHKRRFAKVAVFLSGLKRPFDGWHDAGRYLGWSADTVKRALGRTISSYRTGKLYQVSAK